ncbi:MAG: DUF3387 domain-containing protein [Desulfobacteraceae bacterium]|nr:DUF3387 domain-containing protein [Desulfobacteraceae bacterium]
MAVGDLNDRIAEKLAELETDDIDVTQRLQQELGRDYHVLTAGSRLDQVARDFVRHYARSWETGKAMLVCIDKITCVRMHKLITFYWDEQIREMEQSLSTAADDQEEMYGKRQLQWMRETRMAVVVSEEQGEVEKFRQWDLDIIPHRRLIKEGMDLPASMRDQPRYANMQRLALEDAFKNATHPFRVAIVCAMWLTGFDVPCLSTLYLDKPLKAHTLMQAIARANRISEDKNNGMIVDYCGILKNLRKALATFAGAADGGRDTGGVDTNPARPDRDLLEDLAESIALVRSFLTENGASLDKIVSHTGFQRNAAILAAKEAANDTDETRKRFEVMCRMVFTRFKACHPVEGVARYRSDYDAINIVYKSLQQDRAQADITGIIRQLHQVVDEAIEIREAGVDEHRAPYDISNIDFDRLRQEFVRSPAKRTTVQNLKTVIEKHLQRMLQQNPSRMDFQRRYEEMVAAYNREKDRVTIEETFDELMQIHKEMGEEKNRAVREGLDEESLALFDLLRKPELTPGEFRRIKAVAVDLLKTIKIRISRIDHWITREATRDAVRLTIQDFLWEETTGLPVEHYTDHDVKIRTEEIFRHVYRVYPVLPSPFYENRTAA